jgi:hypothetical protein
MARQLTNNIGAVFFPAAGIVGVNSSGTAQQLWVLLGQYQRLLADLNAGASDNDTLNTSFLSAFKRRR